MKKPKLKIQMLGSFELECGENRLTASGHQSEKPWIMLAYLLLNRGASVEAADLYRAIEGKEPTTDPARAMKNQLYRLRKMLDQLGFMPGNYMILYDQGEYAWNSQMACEVDLDQFWNWIDKAEKARGTGQKMHYFKSALNYYHGDLLSEFFYYPWMEDERDWVGTAFLKAAETAILKLEDNGEWPETEALCRQLLPCRPESFFLKEHFLRALIAEEKNTEAMAYAMELQLEWERDFGVSIAEVWPDIYRLLGAEEQAKYLDMDYLQKQIMEDGPAKGAFLAEFGIFRSVYQLTMRTADRYQMQSWLCQFSFRNLGYDSNEAGFEEEKAWVGKLLRGTLRKGDLASCYCPGEYLLLLTVEHEYDLPRIFRRIAERCTKQNIQAQISVQYERVTKQTEEPIRKWTTQNG